MVVKKKKNENSEIRSKKDKKKKIKISKKIVLVSLVALISIMILIGGIIFFVNKIPSKYYGTYIDYYYLNGEESSTSYKISPLSIKLTNEYIEDGKKKVEEKNIDYYKKGKDLIINQNGVEEYVILDDDCLYIESSKDISFSKEYGFFYWNKESDKADLYEIEDKSEGIEKLIETTVNSWTREIIYDTSNQEMEDSNFYIFESDEETDKTDLNTYEIKFDAAGGELSLYYNRKSKELERIYFSGSVLATSYGGVDTDSMSVNDLYDCRAILLASMYILGNKDDIELNQDTENQNNYSKAIIDLTYRTEVAEEFDELFKNETTDEVYEDKITYSLSNDKYNVRYENWVTSYTYSVSGIISWSISLK